MIIITLQGHSVLPEGHQHAHTHSNKSTFTLLDATTTQTNKGSTATYNYISMVLQTPNILVMTFPLKFQLEIVNVQFP